MYIYNQYWLKSDSGLVPSGTKPLIEVVFTRFMTLYGLKHMQWQLSCYNRNLVVIISEEFVWEQNEIPNNFSFFFCDLETLISLLIAVIYHHCRSWWSLQADGGHTGAGSGRVSWHVSRSHLPCRRHGSHSKSLRGTRRVVVTARLSSSFMHTWIIVHSEGEWVLVMPELCWYHGCRDPVHKKCYELLIQIWQNYVLRLHKK